MPDSIGRDDSEVNAATSPFGPRISEAESSRPGQSGSTLLYVTLLVLLNLFDTLFDSTNYTF